MSSHLLETTAAFNGSRGQPSVVTGGGAPHYIIDAQDSWRDNGAADVPTVPAITATALFPQPPVNNGLEAFLAGRALVGVNDLLKGTGLGRTTLYEQIWAGRLVARKLGRRTVFHADDVRAWLQNLPAYTNSAV